ncbi:17.0 kDa class II heat shock protein-like [Musa acuminata AAA Group]|uniref:17.0 kDa class II heat shock protein-like n=1 Tax=Musa acuminata AAA Group TaxID=214697 RepID=UPI0031D345E6
MRGMDVMVGFEDNPLMAALHHLMDLTAGGNAACGATCAYVRDCGATASTPADVKELPSKLVFEIDMPGVKPGDVRVQVEDDRSLVVSGERRRCEDGEGEYVSVERRVGKFMREFQLPEDADLDAITALCQDGVLTVTVEKPPPAEPKKPKTIDVKMG